MKIDLKNLGILNTAQFELGKLTVICGKNNTGKTYAVYAVYGFLKLWKGFITFNNLKQYSEGLLEKGKIKIDLSTLQKNIPNLMLQACKRYTNVLHKIFASSEKLFDNTIINITVDKDNADLSKKYIKSIRSGKKDLFVCYKEENNNFLEITSLQEKEEEPLSQETIELFLNDILLDIIFSPLFPNPFIASTERTGAAIFRRELNFARNRLVEDLGNMERDLDPFKLLDRVYDSYPLPVNNNVEFTRDFENISKKESYIAKEFPEILAEFQDIIGGDYKVVRDELYFIPKIGKIKLTMSESSSASRSLLDIGFYLKHIAQKNDILIVDEPELNLHPENQRRVARLFSRLVNIGMKIFITTHSDYIIKEFNTLIMLNSDKNHVKDIRRKYNYNTSELLSVEQIKAYSAGKYLVKLPEKSRKTREYSLMNCKTTPSYGIEVNDFDDGIIEMNQIQEGIIIGGE